MYAKANTVFYLPCNTFTCNSTSHLNIEIILKLYDSIANIWAILKVENIAYTD